MLPILMFTMAINMNSKKLYFFHCHYKNLLISIPKNYIFSLSLQKSIIYRHQFNRRVNKYFITLVHYYLVSINCYRFTIIIVIRKAPAKQIIDIRCRINVKFTRQNSLERALQLVKQLIHSTTNTQQFTLGLKLIYGIGRYQQYIANC